MADRWESWCVAEQAAGELVGEVAGRRHLKAKADCLHLPSSDTGSRISLQHQASSLLSFLALFGGMGDSRSLAETLHKVLCQP